jgi:hypothetical protein
MYLLSGMSLWDMAPPWQTSLSQIAYGGWHKILQTIPLWPHLTTMLLGHSYLFTRTLDL